MSAALQAVRGMHDLLPADTPRWQALETRFATCFAAYGYQEIRLPLLERTELFRRSIGTATDIVEKEMYSFADRNGDSLALRPEGTAGCARAVLEHGLLRAGALRLWYAGPMFRHERPQAGRYRQFYQQGAEAYGYAGPDADAELIALSARLLAAAGIADVRLELNSLGDADTRARYRAALRDFFAERRELLDEDSLRRLDTNPLRILDSKHPPLAAAIAQAPALTDFLDQAARAHFEGVQTLLRAAGIAYRVNPRLVRGLDYYNRTVFEWVTDRLGAQGTVCAGGRYDHLVRELGGPDTPAVGFALGMERLLALAALEPADTAPQAYLVLLGAAAETAGFALAEALRSALPGLRLVLNTGGGSAKTQFKRADRSGALLALVLGAAELERDAIVIKPLRAADAAQDTVPRAELIAVLQAHLAPPSS